MFREDAKYGYSVDYEIEDFNDCEAYGCDSICRCRTIENVTIKDSIYSKYNFYNDVWDSKDEKDIDNVIAFMFAKALFNHEEFEADWSGGYYGDELGRISFNSDSFWKKAEVFNQASTTEKLHMALESEYGHVLKKVKDIEDWEMVQASAKSINQSVIPNKERVSDYKDLLKQCYYKHILLERLKLFVPIVIGNNIIDGHHRFAALDKEYNTYVQKRRAVVPKKTKRKAARSLVNVKTPKTEMYMENVKYMPKGIWIICPKESS